MMFRSAMCPNCDSMIKIDCDSDTVFCANCGIQLEAEDAFVYYELKTGDAIDAVNRTDSYQILAKCGADYLAQKKHDLADACFSGILANSPNDYQIWKLRALAWESRVVNELHKSFYEFTLKDGLVENKELVNKFKEYCNNAVRHCPTDMASGLAEEFNEHIRGHFNIAHKAYITDRRRKTAYAVLTACSFFALAALALNSCRK